MISYLIALLCALSVSNGAPTASISSPFAQQFVVLTPPQPAQPLQYESVLKLDQPLFQQITPLGRLETPQKQQLLLLYPNGPLTQYPLISLRQDGGAGPDFWQTIQNFFQNIGGQFGATEAPPAAPPAAPAETIKFLDEKPSIPAALSAAAPPAAAPAALLPASTVHLTEKRYYILSGQPQFYGKYDPLQAPLNSVFQLQPLQSIDARAAASEISAGDVSSSGPVADIATALTPGAQQVELPAVPLLRSSFLPLQSPVLTNSADTDTPAELVAEQLPAAAALKHNAGEPNMEDARSIAVVPAPESDDQQAPNDSILAVEPSVDVNARASEFSESIADEEQPSVANARPTGIAVAGKGGLASSKPSATALVGDYGMAMAAPMATAISGEFKDEEEEEEEIDESKKSNLKFDKKE